MKRFMTTLVECHRLATDSVIHHLCGPVCHLLVKNRTFSKCQERFGEKNAVQRQLESALVERGGKVGYWQVTRFGLLHVAEPVFQEN